MRRERKWWEKEARKKIREAVVIMWLDSCLGTVKFMYQFLDVISY